MKFVPISYLAYLAVFYLLYLPAGVLVPFFILLAPVATAPKALEARS